MKRMARALLLLLALGCVLAGAPARAEVSEVKMARLYGLAFLPLMVMEHDRLIERHAAQAGLGSVTASWAQFVGGNTLNDALLADGLHVAAGGVPPFLVLWAKTRGTPLEVKAMAAKVEMPMILTTRRPELRTIADLTERDRIAVSAVRISGYSIALQMAAEARFGPDATFRFDPLTVTLAPPDAMAALLSGAGEITAHFTAPPFTYQELKAPGMHRVLNSYDVMGGPTTFNVIWTTRKFREANPRTYAAILAAFREAIDTIGRDHAAAARLYLEMSGEKAPVADIQAMLDDPEIVFSLTPRNVARIAAFMQRTGTIKVAPADWRELFFPEVHDLPGS